LADIFIFSARHCRSPLCNKTSRALLMTLLHALIPLVASKLEFHVLNIYPQLNDLSAHPRVLRTTQNRMRGGVDPETAWSTLVRSRALANVGPATVVAVKSDEAAWSGVHACNGSRWN
jgi:hypothetical protein